MNRSFRLALAGESERGRRGVGWRFLRMIPGKNDEWWVYYNPSEMFGMQTAFLRQDADNTFLRVPSPAPGRLNPPPPRPSPPPPLPCGFLDCRMRRIGPAPGDETPRWQYSPRLRSSKFMLPFGTEQISFFLEIPIRLVQDGMMDRSLIESHILERFEYNLR